MKASGMACAAPIATRIAASSRVPAVRASQRTGSRKSPPKPEVDPPAASRRSAARAMYPSGIPRVASRGTTGQKRVNAEQRGAEHRCRRHDRVVEPGARRQEEQPVRRDDCDERERDRVLRRPALRACVGACAPEAGYELGGRCGQRASWSGRTGFRGALRLLL